jgi:hypothetical protein
MASRLDVSGPCASVIYVLSILGGICRAGVDLRESPGFPSSHLSSTTRKFLEQTWGKLHSLAYEAPKPFVRQARLFLHPHISITIPTPPTRIPI